MSWISGSRFLNHIERAVCLFEAGFKERYQKKLVDRESESWILGSAKSFAGCTQVRRVHNGIDSGRDGADKQMPRATSDLG